MRINRRNFVKNAAIAGIGTAAITVGGVTNAAESGQQKKKPATSPSDGSELVL